VVDGKTKCVLVAYVGIVVVVDEGGYEWGVPREGPDFANDVYFFRSSVPPILVHYWFNIIIIISQPVRMKSNLSL